jgi:NADPH:quinone reductase-like Zn-dependent oxidoreductase
MAAENLNRREVMKVVAIRRFGGPDCVAIEEREVPRPGPGEVLIRMRAAGLNRVDITVREGRFAELHRQQPLPLVLGVEGAGEIAALGPGVTSHEVGERVAVLPMVTCGTCEYCVRGLLSQCEKLTIVGEHFDGTFAEYIVLPARNALKVPDGPSYEELAVSIVAYMTAWHMLCTRGQLQRGETMLIVGAGSGMGTAALQLAKASGARVIATTGTAEKCRQLLDAGADAVVDYNATPEWDDAVRELTAGKGVDLVHDTVGGATFQKSINALRHGGRLVAMGSHSGRTAEVQLLSIHRNEIDIRGCHTAHLSEIEAFMPLLANGSLRPIIDSVYAFDRVHDALDRLASAERLGKIALSIA